MQHNEVAAMDEDIDQIQGQLYELEASSQLSREEHDMLTEKLIGAVMEVVSQVADYHERHATILSSLKLQYQSSLTTLFHNGAAGGTNEFGEEAVDTSGVSLAQLSYLQTPAHLKGQHYDEEDEEDYSFAHMQEQDGVVDLSTASSSVSVEEEELLKQHRSHLSFYQEEEEDSHFDVQDVSAISNDLSFDGHQYTAETNTSSKKQKKSSRQVGFASPSLASPSLASPSLASPSLASTPVVSTPTTSSHSVGFQDAVMMYSSPVNQHQEEEEGGGRKTKVSTPFPSQQTQRYYPVEEEDEEEEEASPVASRTRSSSQKKKNKKKALLPSSEERKSRQRTPLSKSARKQQQEEEEGERRRSLKPRQKSKKASSSSRRKTTAGISSSSSSPLRDTTNQEQPQSQWAWEQLAGETDMSQIFGKKAKITRTPPQQQRQGDEDEEDVAV
jgi:hypothetical protein